MLLLIFFIITLTAQSYKESVPNKFMMGSSTVVITETITETTTRTVMDVGAQTATQAGQAGFLSTLSTALSTALRTTTDFISNNPHFVPGLVLVGGVIVSIAGLYSFGLYINGFQRTTNQIIAVRNRLEYVTIQRDALENSLPYLNRHVDASHFMLDRANLELLEMTARDASYYEIAQQHELIRSLTRELDANIWELNLVLTYSDQETSYHEHLTEHLAALMIDREQYRLYQIPLDFIRNFINIFPDMSFIHSFGQVPSMFAHNPFSPSSANLPAPMPVPPSDPITDTFASVPPFSWLVLILIIIFLIWYLYELYNSYHSVEKTLMVAKASPTRLIFTLIMFMVSYVAMMKVYKWLFPTSIPFSPNASEPFIDVESIAFTVMSVIHPLLPYVLVILGIYVIIWIIRFIFDKDKDNE